MNHDHKSLLDRRREGQEFSLADINRALQDAGDLAPDRSERLDSPIPTESKTVGAAEGAVMVAGSKDEPKEAAWPGWSRYLDCRNGETT